MHVVLWEYEVMAGHAARFEQLYGPDGEWAALFRRDAAFVDTQLLRADDGRYLTVDRWRSAQAYQDFLHRVAADYARIDALGDALTLSERCVGACALVGGPADPGPAVESPGVEDPTTAATLRDPARSHAVPKS